MHCQDDIRQESDGHVSISQSTLSQIINGRPPTENRLFLVAAFHIYLFMENKFCIPYQKEKIVSAVNFFRERYSSIHGEPIRHQKMWFCLALLDFMSAANTGCPALGLDYRATEYGPEPQEIVLGEIKQDRLNLDYFSTSEIVLIEKIVQGADSITQFDISPWRKTWKKGDGDIIDYNLCFDSDLPTISDQHKRRSGGR